MKTLTQFIKDSNHVWLATDRDGDAYIFDEVPERSGDRTHWIIRNGKKIEVGYNGALRVFSKRLTWNDEPIKIK